MGSSCSGGNRVGPAPVPTEQQPYVDDIGGRILNIRKSDLATAYEGELFVLETDMSGVTSMTKKFGAVHFAGIILKMRQLVTPIFEAYHPVSLETAEADNFTVAFRTPQAALKAAMECMAQMKRYNDTQPEEFQPIIGGYGIACGTDTIKAVGSGKLYGEAKDVSFRLGEDVAEDSILIDHKVYEQLKDRAEFARCKFERRMDKENNNRVYYQVDGEFTGPRMAQWPYPQWKLPEFIDSAKYINKLLTRATASQSQREAIDSECKSKLVQKLAIIMLGLELNEFTEEYGVLHALGCMDKIVKLIRPLLERYNGEFLEETVFGFKNGRDAALAALAIKQAFQAVNKRHEHEEKWKIPCKGIGCHYGDVLIMRGTDIHWGDPLNTSSKVAEDAAEGNASLCITDTIHKDVDGDRAFNGVKFLPRDVKVSGVHIKCYVLDSENYHDPHVQIDWATDPAE